MTTIDAQEVKKVAKLARVSLTDAEVQLFTEQLGEIVKYVEHLNRVPTDTVSETHQVTDLVNVQREDVVAEQPEGVVDELLASAPSRSGRAVKVKHIFSA